MEFASPSSAYGGKSLPHNYPVMGRRSSNDDADQYSTPFSTKEPLSLDDDHEDICSPQVPNSTTKLFSKSQHLSPETEPSSQHLHSYEVVWRDEKIRLLDQDRNNALLKVEEYAKQNLILREELKKSQKNTNNPTVEINQLKHERYSIQEYAEQLRQQKNNLQEQLHSIKQGQSNVERDLENKESLIRNQEYQIRELSNQLISFQRQCEQLISEREKLKNDHIEAQTNLHTKTAELEELNGVQEELLKAMSEEKKRANDFQKLQTSEVMITEKLKKDNERLELLVDKLQSDLKKEQQENFNQRLKFNATLEETHRKMLDDNDKLGKSLSQLKRESEEKELQFKNQVHSQQHKISTLTDQLREQVDKYEKNLSILKTEETDEKKKHSQQVLKLKKELSSSLEMIKLLKEANRNLEDNFVQHQKIISTLEERLQKEIEEKDELSESLDILKNKLPRMLALTNNQNV